VIFAFLRVDYYTQRRWLIAIVTRAFIAAAVTLMYFDVEAGGPVRLCFGALAASMLVTGLATITGGLRGVWSFARPRIDEDG
jgi:hypothetical protein